MVKASDDTIIFSTDAFTIEKLLHKIEECAEPYGLKLNHNKCESICTGPHYKYKTNTKTNHFINKRKEAKPLGCKLNYESNIRAELAKRKATCNHVWRKLENFWKHSNTSDTKKLHVYNAVITSKLLYGLESANLTDRMKKIT
jgi:hypothetical protein